jgi:hypothetical protein
MSCGREVRPGPGHRCLSARPRPAVRTASPVDVIEKAFALAEKCGGIGQLKRLVDRLAGA